MARGDVRVTSTIARQAELYEGVTTAIRQIRALPPGHLIGRLLDLSHINWQTCAANQLSDHSDRHRRSIAGRPRQT
jgi:hypothetical protein